MIEGIILDKNNLPLNSVVVELKNESFQTFLSTKSDSTGYFVFKENNGTYAYLTAVKEYAIEYLEYWCRNINLENDAHFDIVIDKLGIYNLMAFDNEGSMSPTNHKTNSWRKVEKMLVNYMVDSYMEGEYNPYEDEDYY